VTAVGVIGLGGMGSRIAGRLIDAGHEVVVWNRSPQRMAPLVDLGADAAATPAKVASRVEILITMVADLGALRSVTEGPDGIAAGARASLIVVEMSTVGPAGIAWLAAALPPGVTLLDAPVLGSIGEADAGSLRIFVGGPDSLVERVQPVLSELGSVSHVGALGSGAACKLVANATLFATLASLGEALALARALGLSDEVAYEVLAATPLAAQADRRRDAIAAGEYPPRFPLALARKDAELVRDAAATAHVELRTANAARAWLADAERAGSGERDYTAVLGTILGGSGHAKATPEIGAPTVGYDGVIVDLDGVVWLSGRPIDGAVEAIAALRSAGTRVLFLTNDPQSSRAEQARRLTAVGIPATEADVLTSAAALARSLAAQERFVGCGVLVVGSTALADEIRHVGLRVLPSPMALQAEVVVVGGHEGFSYADLRAATAAVGNGAPLYATGRDAVFPTSDGLRPATGAILAAIEVASGVTATVVGKPEPLVFDIARESLAGCQRIAVVGDHLDADIAGAKRAGLDAILVLTGATGRDELEWAAVQPDQVLASLAEFAAGQRVS
jgi:HAD superfamily hydrolase (TIGR01450 family)